MTTKQTIEHGSRASHQARAQSAVMWSALTAEMTQRYHGLLESNGTHFVIALELLGGRKILSKPPRSVLALHEWVSQGIPSVSIAHLAHAVEPVSAESLSKALGFSLRTLHRKKGEATDTLTAAQGGRAFKFAEVIAKATLVFGSKEAAVKWLTTQAIGLDGKKPWDLLETPIGTQLVEDLLGRIEHGVYA